MSDKNTPSSHLSDPIYKTLPAELIAASAESIRSEPISNLHASDYSRPGQIRRHVASLLPSNVDADVIYDTKIRSKAILMAFNKTYVLLAGMRITLSFDSTFTHELKPSLYHLCCPLTLLFPQQGSW